MRLYLTMLAVISLTTGAALAQTNTTAPATTGPAAEQPAVAVPDANAPAQSPASAPEVAVTALESGANSFTEDQARERLEETGLAEVSELAKDDQGIWRGKAMRDGKQVSVGLDYKGNIAVE